MTPFRLSISESTFVRAKRKRRFWPTRRADVIEIVEYSADREVGHESARVLARDLFHLLQVVPIMAAHGLDDGLQRHVAPFGMIHGLRPVRGAE